MEKLLGYRMQFFGARGVWRGLVGALAIATLGWPASAAAQAFQTIYSFQGSPDGMLPFGIVFDPTTGNIYGTTRSGGNTAPCPANSVGNTVDGIPFAGCGVIFKLSQAAKGAPWTETVVHAFTADADGAYPPDVGEARLVLNNGALYGTTEYGGNTTCQGGCGAVYQFDLATNTLQTIHAFTGGADLGNPYGGVVPDANGVLYGTLQEAFGGNNNLVYKLTPPNWTFTALHPSTGGGDNEIRSGLVVDKAGNLYGMSKQGTLFMLTPPTYAETTLFTFTNGAAGIDQSVLTIQFLASGAPVLYGVTRQGGPNNAGTVFKFDPATGTLTTLHTFTGGADGAFPLAPVVLDSNGVLYGATATGGNLTNCPAFAIFPPGCGTVFKLDPAIGTLTTLHTFTGGADGWGGGGVALGANGTLYGLTFLGGNLTSCPATGGFPPGCGTVFAISFATDSHDFNADGMSDIAWRDTSGNAAVWLMNGAQVMQSANVGSAPTIWSVVGQRDFNGDGKADWLWHDTGGNVAMWFLNGTQVTQSAGVGNVPTAWSIVGTGDFNGDGKGDILWADSNGNVAVWLMNGAQVMQSASVGSAPTAWSIVGTGDFDGDGKTDILWHDSSGNVAIWFMNGTQVTSSAGVGNVPTAWSIVGTADFNGDGKSDILWHDTSGNVAVWLMNGAQVSQSAGLGSAPTAWSIVETGDFNGDGKSDILWHDTGGNVAMWFMNGAQVTQSAGVGNVPTAWSIQGANAD